jgi:copper resistance protein B
MNSRLRPIAYAASLFLAGITFPAASVAAEATASSPAPPIAAAGHGSSHAQEPPDRGAATGHAGHDSRILDNLAPERDLAPPVADEQRFSFLLFDRLEYGGDGLHWDLLGWQGGDVHRWWFKSEGDQSTRARGGEADVQFLRGRLISPFLDLQYGLRFEGQWGDGTRGRAFAVIGLQGLAPYRYEIEPALFISQEGDVSARFTATYDTVLTQRLILQPRLETNLALQRVERFGVGSGLNDLELALLLRYEIRREFAPYIGISWKNSFGDSARFLRREGLDPHRLQFLVGVRAWF